MTASAWTALSAAAGDDGGFVGATAAQNRWSVQASVVCALDPDAGAATSTTQTLICAVTDRTVDVGGLPVAPSALPNLWPYSGPQPPAVLAMRRAGRTSTWLVDADQTGQAG